MIDMRLIVQYLILAFSIGACQVWYLWARRNPKIAGYAVAPFLWALHRAVFYTVYFLLPSPKPVNLLNLWTAAINLQGMITVFLVGLVLLLEKRHE